MKKILITGANSYIGTSVAKWLLQWPDKFFVDTIDMIDGSWRSKDFSSYDVVYHVAGIAHVSSKKKMAPLYFKVNRDLAIETAEKAKREGVKQFIFMSSMIIYGKDNRIGDHRPIDVTRYAPINAYGKSKLDADLAIQKLADESFKVVISRTPVVYGPSSKGNFTRLIMLARKIPIIPKMSNKRSMIFIDNLAEFIRVVIQFDESGVFYPQNSDYVSVLSVIKETRAMLGLPTIESSIFRILIIVTSVFMPRLRKVFGDKYFELCSTEYRNNNYVICDFVSSLNKTLS